MAEVERYLLYRQPQVLERSDAEHACGGNYFYAFFLLAAIVSLTLGRYGAAAVWSPLAAMGVLHFSRKLRRRFRTISPGGLSTAAQPAPPEAPFPSHDALLALVSDSDRPLLDPTPPRCVRNSHARTLGLVAVSLFFASVLEVGISNAASNKRGDTFAWLVAGLGGLLMTALLAQEARRAKMEKGLQIQGRTALGLVILQTEEGGRGKHRKIWYDFCDGAGKVHRCSGRDGTKRCLAGSVVVVFYDPDQPEKQVARPCSSLQAVSSRSV